MGYSWLNQLDHVNARMRRFGFARYGDRPLRSINVLYVDGSVYLYGGKMYVSMFIFESCDKANFGLIYAGREDLAATCPVACKLRNAVQALGRVAPCPGSDSSRIL